jgi:hypothetical protein
LKGNYSFIKKEEVYETFIEILKEKKKEKNITYNEYMMEHFKKGFDKYMLYINLNLEKIKKEIQHVTKYEK